MEAKDMLLKLRTERGLSQDALAEKLFVTRQAVSRWERGDTLPNTETLKLLSKLYDVSINTLLGSPRTLICQCCGMPLDDTTISREPGGAFNEDYCKWCYTDGCFVIIPSFANAFLKAASILSCVIFSNLSLSMTILSITVPKC